MGSISKIEWTNASWNPITGCNKISPGCKNCYAELMSLRLMRMGQKNYKNGFKLTLHEESLTIPLRWKKPKMIFVNSMSDIFHEKVPFEYINRMFDAMRQADWHIFQILTKRSSRLLELNKKINWPDNVWMGVSVENKDYVYRIKDLVSTNAKIKFISFEPLLGSVSNADLKGIDWAIVGGESGRASRVMEPEWVIDIQRKCEKEGVAFFFKQWGGRNKKKAGRILNGRVYNEMPQSLGI